MSSVGFIGTGNMGTVVARLVCATVGGSEMLLSNRSQEKAERLAQELMAAVSDNVTIAEQCDMIFLAVKPQMMGTVMREIAPNLAMRTDSFTLVSMAAGLSIARIQELAGGKYPVIRMMPNTPLTVGKGVVTYCATRDCPHLQQFGRWMSEGGLAEEIVESQMDVASAVSGCGPAFCAMFLEAMADGAVLSGLPRAQALRYAAQTMIGTGELLLQAELHAGEIKDAVCSPGGSTIRGVAALEEAGLRSAVIQAVTAAYDGNKSLGK